MDRDRLLGYRVKSSSWGSAVADTFSAFQTLKDAGFDDKASAAIVRQIALALPETAHCDRETIADGLCDDQEFSVAQAEILADILSHCYWGMRFRQKFKHLNTPPLATLSAKASASMRSSPVTSPSSGILTIVFP